MGSKKDKDGNQMGSQKSILLVFFHILLMKTTGRCYFSSIKRILPLLFGLINFLTTLHPRQKRFFYISMISYQMFASPTQSIGIASSQFVFIFASTIFQMTLSISLPIDQKQQSDRQLQHSMNEVNESNVAVKLSLQHLQYQGEEGHPPALQQEINPQTTAIITENVPMTRAVKINKWYIGSTILADVLIFIMAMIFGLTSTSLVAKFFLVAIAGSSYLIYLIFAYKFSTLLPLINLRSLHEYDDIFRELTSAGYQMKFIYVHPRNMVDEAEVKNELVYDKVEAVDRSGTLYHIETDCGVAIIRYRKRYYFCDGQLRRQVNSDFNDFVASCKRDCDPLGRKRLRGREKIEFTIDGMIEEMGYYIEEGHSYRFMLILTVVLGLGAYYDLFMSGRVLRYQIDIVKEICQK